MRIKAALATHDYSAGIKIHRLAVWLL